MIFSLASVNRRRERGCGDDGVDAAVGDDVRDFFVAEEIVNRHDALAREERSVETGDKAGGGRQQDADVRLSGLDGEIHPQSRRHCRQLLVCVSPAVVDDGQVLRMARCVGKKRFDKHAKIHVQGRSSL